MIRYKEFKPTQFDPKGLGLPERQDWFVAPIGRTRDSSDTEIRKFDKAVKVLGGESDTVEIHRFGHWGPGWFELLLVDPADKKQVAKLEKLEASRQQQEETA